MSTDQENLTTIEINGVKMQVDLRHAKRIDEFRIGDRVKVLTKDYSGFSVHPGTIVGFEPFEKLPTIVIAYVVSSYADIKLEMLHFNASTKDIELVKAVDDDLVELSRSDAMAAFEKKIAAKEREIAEVREHLEYFERNFARYWEHVSLDMVPDQV